MELVTAENIAIKLMEEHGLIQQGWSFAFDRALYRLGLCRFDRKQITISKHFTSEADEYELKQAALHEIAHALLPIEAKHGQAWQDKALEIGYMGTRLAHNPFSARRRKRQASHVATAIAGLQKGADSEGK